MSVRINVSIPAGEIEVTRDQVWILSEDGTRDLAGKLVEAANAVLRSYGLPASISATTPRERLIEEAPARGGW